MLDEDIKGSEDIKEKMTFFKSTAIQCPVCNSQIYGEELRQGRSRINAGNLRDDLFRNYIPNEESGETFPFLYSVGVCNNPKCFFAAFWQDFKKIHKKNVEALSTTEAKNSRIDALNLLYKSAPDFTQKRNLLSGFASYLLALETYNKFRENDAPSIRQGICALRLAWLSRILHEHKYGDECKQLETIFYKKALFFYTQSLTKDSNGLEPLHVMTFLGPDIDKDYGYDGVVYIRAWLEFHYGDKRRVLERQNMLNTLRNSLSKVFGFGRSSKEKPSVLLNIARKTFEAVETEIASFEQ